MNERTTTHDGPQDGLPNISNRRLFASTPERQDQERRETEKLTSYRRNYWQNYKTKIRRGLWHDRHF